MRIDDVLLANGANQEPEELPGILLAVGTYTLNVCCLRLSPPSWPQWLAPMSLLALLMGLASSGARCCALAGAEMTLKACSLLTLLFAWALALARACARPNWMLVVIIVGACSLALASARASLLSIWAPMIVGTFDFALARALLRSKAFGLHLALLKVLASGRVFDFALATLSAASIADFAMALLKPGVLSIITEAADLLQAPHAIGIAE